MSDEKKRVDEDWKRRAQAEKELDAAKVGDRKEAPAAPGAGPAPGKKAARPSPHFAQLVESLASQALMFMGAAPDPMTGERFQDLPQAQAMINLLGMLEEKTQGNLAADEEEMLKQILSEVRMTFVRISSPPPPRAGGPMMGNQPRG